MLFSLQIAYIPVMFFPRLLEYPEPRHGPILQMKKLSSERLNKLPKITQQIRAESLTTLNLTCCFFLNMSSTSSFVRFLVSKWIALS